MDKREIVLATASIGITAASIATAVFLWNHLSPARQEEQAVLNSDATAPQQQERPLDASAAQEEGARTITTDTGRSQEQPTAAAEKEPKSAVRVSLPDPNDAVSDKSVEKFQSDEDEEDTDDGITIETEPDDE